jgi:hypothetical protein
MKTVLLFTVVILNTLVYSQNNNSPQTDIKVNKEYDENGNLIRYDSTYTYFYSSEGDPINFNLNDSLFMNDRFFSNGLFNDSDFFMFPGIPSFEDFFNNDNFIMNDPFFQDFEKLHQEMIDKMKNMQDSISTTPEKMKNPDALNESETITL